MSVKYEMLDDRVLVEREKEAEKTKGGLYIPDTANKEKSTCGTVIAIGEGKLLKNGELRPFKIKPGDKIIYSKYAGTEPPKDENSKEDKDYLILRWDDILAKVIK